MKRSYLIGWYPNKDAKYREPFIRVNKIMLVHPTGKTEYDAKEAVNIFTKTFGNLKNNTIKYIKEFDENGEQLGEDIVPTDNEIVVPVK